jgi:hypothetical protein
VWRSLADVLFDRNSVEDVAQLQFSPIGVAMVGGAVLAEAIQGNWQEALLSSSQGAVPRVVVMCFTNVLAAFLCITLLLASGELAHALAFISQDSIALALVCVEVMALAHFAWLGSLFSRLEWVT